jgi:hypothetical protein
MGCDDFIWVEGRGGVWWVLIRRGRIGKRKWRRKGKRKGERKRERETPEITRFSRFADS